MEKEISANKKASAWGTVRILLSGMGLSCLLGLNAWSQAGQAALPGAAGLGGQSGSSLLLPAILGGLLVGLGLDPQEQAKLFTMFKRLHTHVEGTGVGLYIIKRMVENNKGKVTVESEKGVGTTFRIHLPILEVPEPAVADLPEA